MRIFAVAAALAALTTGAQAATVASGATTVDNSAGIVMDGSGTTIASDNAAYNNQDIGADWVWDTNSFDVNRASFTFNFDLSGFDVTTAALTGIWGVDNIGSILLNGVEIASLTGIFSGNFAWNNLYGTSDSSLFNAGLNTVTYLAEDLGGPGAIRATILVEADELPGSEIADSPSQVPLPAGGLLLVTGLGLLALRRRKG